MIFERRTFLVCGAAGLALAGCQEAAAPVMAVSAQSQPGMNPGPDGADRPVTVNVLQMAGSANFDAADVFALQDPQTAVGADLLRNDALVLSPGGTASRAIAVQPGATVIGITAGFRDPGGKTVRTKISAPASDQGVVILVGPGGLSVQTT